MNNCTKEELMAFEEEVIANWKAKKILSPVHLSGSVNGEQEDALIEIFKEIQPQDWIFSTYRSHYHALLKGMPKKELMQWILDNKSIHLMSKKYKIVTSAIVGGTLSQAVGCAMAIKRMWSDSNTMIEVNMNPTTKHFGKVIEIKPHVWVFCGDMTASLGTFRDCVHYSYINDLPITFVVEDNKLSTDTPTQEAWGGEVINKIKQLSIKFPMLVKYYQYQRSHPHYGTGIKIDFSGDKT